MRSIEKYLSDTENPFGILKRIGSVVWPIPMSLYRCISCHSLGPDDKVLINQEEFGWNKSTVLKTRRSSCITGCFGDILVQSKD